MEERTTQNRDAAPTQYMERFMQFAQRAAGSSDTIVTELKITGNSLTRK